MGKAKTRGLIKKKLRRSHKHTRQVFDYLAYTLNEMEKWDKYQDQKRFCRSLMDFVAVLDDKLEEFNDMF